MNLLCGGNLMSNSRNQATVSDMDEARSFKDIEDAIQKAINNETLKTSKTEKKDHLNQAH